MIRVIAICCVGLIAACVPYGSPGRRREARESCGNQRAAYEHGYNDGMERKELRTDWIDQYCAPPDQAPTRAAYTNGYQTGVQSAPAAVVVQPAGGGYGPAPCALNSDGTQTCGYNCKLGSNGYHYCASIPNGQCALNSDGTWACP